jgi:hypothetical protein
LYKELTIELLRSPLNGTPDQAVDFNAPTIDNIGFQAVGEDQVEVTIDAADASGIAKVIVLVIGNGLVVPEILEVATPLPLSGTFTVIAPYTGEERIEIKVVDGKGNVASVTGKGASFNLIDVSVEPEYRGFDPNIELNFTAEVTDFDKLVPPVFYVWDFGDDKSATGQLNVSEPLPLTYELTVPHTYDGSVLQAIATLKITDADGGVGIDTVKITRRTTPDVLIESDINPSIVAQPVTFTATVRANPGLLGGEPLMWTPTPTGGTVIFSIDDTVLAEVPVEVSEGVVTATFTTSSLSPGDNTIKATYSGDEFFLDDGKDEIVQTVHYNFGGFISPIDGSMYNIGRTIPVKFTLTDFFGNEVKTAVATISTCIDDGSFSPPHGKAKYKQGVYQYNFDTSDLVDVVPGDMLTIKVSLDDGKGYTAQLQLK